MFTVGHSTRSLPELVSVLQEHGVKLLVDVRSIPKSGMNPQFNKERLAEQLPGLGLQYMWLGKELGGLRQRNKSSELNAGWDNASFRGKEPTAACIAQPAAVSQVAACRARVQRCCCCCCCCCPPKADTTNAAAGSDCIDDSQALSVCRLR
jgi:uncharacterized protein (DUF488 family)